MDACVARDTALRNQRALLACGIVKDGLGNEAKAQKGES